MKFKLSDKTSRFAKRTLADFSERMIVMLADMPLEEISVQKICDICNYPRSTFYNYFDDIYDLMDYCWIAIMKDMDIEKYLNVQGEQNTEQIFSLLYEYYMYATERKTKKLSVNKDICVGCGVCAKKCLVGAIQMKEGCPVWKSEECEMCLGCLHRCPKFAISYGNGKTDRHGQYKNPYTRI